MFGKSTNNLSGDELRREIQLNKERISEWSEMVNKFGERLKELDREHDHLACEENRLQLEVEGKKQLVAESQAELIKLEDEVKSARMSAEKSAARRLQMEQQAATMKNTLQNLLQAEYSMQREAAAKREAMANEFEPQHATRVAQERMLAEETMAMRHDVDQLKETTEMMRNKEEARQIDVAENREKLTAAETKMQELRQALKEKQEDYERRKKDLSSEVAKKERMLHDSDQELRDKIFALAELNREVEKIESDHNTMVKNNDSVQQHIHAEREQVRSLQMALVEIETKHHTEAERLTRLTAELEQAQIDYKRKSKQMAEMIESEQQAAMNYMNQLESELGDATAEEDRARSSNRPQRGTDPEFEHLHNEVNEKVLELANLKREHEKNLEEAHQEHCRRKAQIEVSNNNMSSEQRFYQLDQTYRKDMELFEKQKAVAELKLSEATSQLANLQAEISSQLAEVSPDLWKLRQTLKDDEQFEHTINKMAKQRELNLHQTDTRLKLLNQQKSVIENKLTQLNKNCEVMQRQLASMKQNKRSTRNADDHKKNTGILAVNTTTTRISMPAKTKSASSADNRN
ncbi:uveal autoantigen with coiled-coil domains and ankyrin repeats-like [Cloeon dipterum]|uniref:uveal autoantigen with coiled-coil domains and ankyrin repeats-like n=1 Tax=Cloeon dipterum TaxID=197152 RepID=UPI00321F6F8A